MHARPATIGIRKGIPGGGAAFRNFPLCQKIGESLSRYTATPKTLYISVERVASFGDEEAFDPTH